MNGQRLVLIAAVAIAVGYAWLNGAFDRLTPVGADAGEYAARDDGLFQRATFAGGCFWCVEADFEKVAGVVDVSSGYTGGRTDAPTYEEVSSGVTGHAEAVQVLFDPSVVSYEQLLEHYWRQVDPFVVHRQFCDVGAQYRPEIFVHTAEQRAAATASRDRVQKRFTTRIRVPITDAGRFHRAEAYHQDYYKKHPVQYRYYRWRCGRDARLAAIWGEARDAQNDAS
jgi:peptide-methionine (S)-S-oxide reductase